MHAPIVTKSVVKRDGTIVQWDPQRIRTAVEKACIATGSPLPGEKLDEIVGAVASAASQAESPLSIEAIQDMVERVLFDRAGFAVGKAYILYRAERNRTRTRSLVPEGIHSITTHDGSKEGLDPVSFFESLSRALSDLPAVDPELLMKTASASWHDAMPKADLERSLVSAASALMEQDPDYDRAASRLELTSLVPDGIARYRRGAGIEAAYYQSFFTRSMSHGLNAGIYTSELARFDLARLAAALVPARDEILDFQGMRTLAERYLIRDGEALLELPQVFWMRVAMGLALKEAQAEEKAIEFYTVMSTLRFVPSTPTLFHSGLPGAQLSSCYVSYVGDDLSHIFKVFGDNAQLSKWSGGIGNDWTAVRATGSGIKSTRVQSQGVIPFLKICNDATVAINRSGKRRGALCAYLETWHLDIEDFLDLKRNTGDERRRTHDMNTANWVPDLFIKRVREGASWTLFSPDEVPDLHELYGAAFESRYLAYEMEAKEGRIAQARSVDAKTLWRKMLSRLYETGHPWITFKDACNIRSPQDHVGVIHNSNLCTEITLNNSAEETAVCNLGSVNLASFVRSEVAADYAATVAGAAAKADAITAADAAPGAAMPGFSRVDREGLAATIKTAVRMLDNVIDLNFYPVPEAEKSNLRHRPVGLGLMGFQDALLKLSLGFDDAEALEFADESTEFFSWQAIGASSDLAAERGSYASFKGSKWDRGILPFDTIALHERERGVPVNVGRKSRLDWGQIREKIAKQGMRNSNVMALAPTATISTIAGTYPSIEPMYKNLYVKSNMSGEFTVLNHYLVDELKKRGLWSRDTLQAIKYHDGDLSELASIPVDLKRRFATAFSIDPVRQLEFTAVRGKWIDQSQSHNIFMNGVSGALLERTYMEAWERGLKTTYYLRTQAASQIEKSTLDASFGFTQKRGAPAPVLAPALTPVSRPAAEIASKVSDRASKAAIEIAAAPFAAAVALVAPADQGDSLAGIKACAIEDPSCESCQ